MQRSGGNNGNIYDLRKDLQRPQAPSQKKETSGSTDSRYGFNGEPLSFAPDRTSNGAVRRTRTDNSIEFPTQPRRTAQSSAPRTRSQGQNRSAPRSRTASAGRNSSGTARRPPQRRPQSQQTGQTADRAARQRYKNQRLRPAQQQQVRDPVRREKRKKRRLTRAALKRRRMMRRLMAFVTLLAVIAAGVYLTMTMLFKIGTIQVQTEDGTVVQEAGGYSSSEIIQALGVAPEENIFSFDPGEKEAALERQFPLLESIRVVRDYPNTVVVQVTEAVPAYAMQTQSGWLTLSDQFKILACGSAQPEGLKTLYGGEAKTTAPGEQLSFAAEDAADSTAASDSAAASSPEEADKKIETLTALQAKLEEYELLDDVTRMEFADTDQVAFLYQDRVSVLLGTLNDLDYKLDRARYVLTNADGKGCAPTDTGRLDFSHVSAGSTRKIYFAQGEPTLPSGYVVPEPEKPAQTEEPSADDTTADGAEDAAAQPAGDTAADASCGSFSCTFGAAASHAFSGPAALPHDSFCSCADAVLHGSSGSAALLHGSFCSCEAVVLHGSSGSVATSHDASAGAVFQDAPRAVSVSGVHADMFCEASGVTAASASSENADGVRFSAGGYPPSDVRGTIFSSRTSGISR